MQTDHQTLEKTGETGMEVIYMKVQLTTAIIRHQLLTFLLLYIVNSEEVDDPRCKVESDVGFVLLDCQTVTVTIACSWHSSTI